VERSLGLLEKLAEGGPAGVHQLARDCALAPSTVQRLLGALSDFGIVQQDPTTRKYQASWQLFRWGQAPLNQLGLREIAKPFIQELAAEVGETIALGVRDGTAVMHIEWIPARHRFQPRISIGDRVPVLDSSLGRCLVAWLGDEPRQELVGLALDEVVDDRRKRTPDEVDQELVEVRSNGYSLVADDIAGICTIAVPVWGTTTEVIGAIGVGGPASRFSVSKAIGVASSLMAVGDAVTGHYGVDSSEARLRGIA
jgi:IclR family transcriptional regulator, KDG regulon repressor